jgi:imidazoleglycerol-phosphate dehydratase
MEEPMSAKNGPREKEVSRRTAETNVTVHLVVDGAGNSRIKSGNGFMDHMLVLFAKHGLFDLNLTCEGDTEVDFHHSAEDIGITMGSAFAGALAEGTGIRRYGVAYIPMDEALARVVVDFGGRPNLSYNVALVDRKINDFECDLVEDFLKAFTDNARATIHVDLLRGRNSHHAIEAVFKALGRALEEATSINSRAPREVPSTKGTL